MTDGPKSRPGYKCAITAAPTRGIHYPIFIGLKQRKFELVISNEIMLEYEEVLRRQDGSDAWVNIKRLLELLQSRTRTVVHVTRTYF